METSILYKLKQHLAAITPEQFQAEWAEIEAMGLQGPSIKDFLASLHLTPPISQIMRPETYVAVVSDEFICSTTGNDNYVIAA